MSGKMKWLVQKEGFAMANRMEAIEVLERFGFDHGSFGLAPPWTKVLNLAQIHEQRFDQAYYSGLGLPL